MVYSTDKNCKIGNLICLLYIIALPKITQVKIAQIYRYIPQLRFDMVVAQSYGNFNPQSRVGTRFSEIEKGRRWGCNFVATLGAIGYVIWKRGCYAPKAGYKQHKGIK